MNKTQTNRTHHPKYIEIARKYGFHFSENGTHGTQSNVDIYIRREFPFQWTKLLRNSIVVANKNKIEACGVREKSKQSAMDAVVVID